MRLAVRGSEVITGQINALQALLLFSTDMQSPASWIISCCIGIQDVWVRLLGPFYSMQGKSYYRNPVLLYPRSCNSSKQLSLMGFDSVVKYSGVFTTCAVEQ